MAGWMDAGELELENTDVLVLGGGLSGSRAAVAAREAGASVVHAYLARGASPFVIGANVPLGHADPRDTAEQYAADMIAGGYALNDRRLVDALAESAVPSFEHLVRLGVPFAREGERFLQRHLSGNTYPRSVYIPEGIGRVVIEHLAAHSEAIGVESRGGLRAVALLIDGDAVVGALLVDRRSGRLVAVHAKAVVLAMGGIGRLYADSTYPSDIAADAYAFALEAGAKLIDMEFVQFEPVVTVSPEACRGMEMPTAMMGDGARLLNAAGERFMRRYNPEHLEKRIEKAKLALCIQREIDEGRGFPGGTVRFDTTTVPADKLESYVAHVKRLRGAGLEPAREGPLVRPAAHSEMGGVLIDADGWTGVPGLYACGEASGGVHGASRLAGNGGGETIAMGWRIGRTVGERVAATPAPPGRDHERVHRAALERLEGGGERDVSPKEIKTGIREVMGAAAGLYREADGLEAAAARLEACRAGAQALATPDLRSALEVRSARNMALIASLIVRAALVRTESRGAHQRRDHPEQDDARWLSHIAFDLAPDGGMREGELEIH